MRYGIGFPIHFGVTIPRAQIDLQLGEKLRTEAPGILAWLAEGARQWYSMGLAVPASVINGREA